eukprot:COSAG06_NODE_968_length_11280_cov_125.578302_7_plen_99_part_00
MGGERRVDAWAGEPVSSLKLTVQKVTGLAPTQQALTWRFKELSPSLLLGSYNIPVGGGRGSARYLLRPLCCLPACLPAACALQLRWNRCMRGFSWLMW